MYASRGDFIFATIFSRKDESAHSSIHFVRDMDVAELTEAFKEHGTGNQAQLMHRVQELMGQGVDVSSLFPSMVSVSPKKKRKKTALCAKSSRNKYSARLP